MQVNFVQATLDADSVYWFPWTAEPPIIDGEMDPVWYTASNLVLEKLVTGYEVDDWFDIWGKCKMLWDNDNLYIFMTVHDDVNQPEAANSYEQDGVEFFFDGDLSQVDAFDGVDDIQLRFNTQWEPGGATYPEAGFGTGTSWEFDRTGVDWAFKFTDLGYNFEGIIPLANLQMEDMYDQVFGFEVQINDNDGDARSAEWKWWNASGNSWQQPSIWGKARMDDNYVDEKLPIQKLYSNIVIDGVMEESWTRTPVFSGNNYVTQTAYVPDDWNIYERIDDWSDSYFDFRIMYSSYCFYFFANVYDDIISTEAGEEWEKDGIELYFDGDNSKNDFTNHGIPYDDNDRHFRQVFSIIPSSNCACQYTDMGWSMEWRVPYVELGWLPADNKVIGFDVQFNDQDDPDLGLSGVSRWWSNDNNSWQDASMFGTAILVGNTCEECAPIATTGNATNITDTTVRLNGFVFANGLVTTVKFQFGLNTNYGNEIYAINSPVSGANNTPIHADLWGLASNTTYHYRTVAINSAGVAFGDDKTFTTSVPLPVVNTLAADHITSTTATLNAQVNAMGLTTNVIFQYGMTGDYGSEVQAANNPVTGTTITPVNAALSGLTPNTIYHYRVVATSSAGTSFGEESTFFTSTNTSFVFTSPATNISQTSATLNGFVNANGVSTVVKFQYGTTNNYNSEITAENSPVLGTAITAVYAQLFGLAPNATFYYRIVATSSEGTSFGEDVTFTTGALSSIAITTSATDITFNSATLNGYVNTNGVSTTVSFEYGLSLDYGSEVPAANSPVNDPHTTAVSAVITGLASNVTFHYRVKCTSSAGTTYGDDMTFTTFISNDIASATPLPQHYALMQNYPNPFNPATNIIYELPEMSKVKMTILNTQGACVKILFEDYQYPGNYQVMWDGTDDSGNKLSSGLYFLRMDADGFMDMKKMMLVK